MAHNNMSEKCCPCGIPCKYLRICPKAIEYVRREYEQSETISLRVPVGSTFEKIYEERLKALGYVRDEVNLDFMTLEFETNAIENEKFKAKPDCP